VLFVLNQVRLRLSLTQHYLFLGFLSFLVRLLDIPTTTPTLVGQLTANAENKVGCSCLASCGADNSPLIASAGWNGHFQLWDIRQSSSSTGSAVSSLELPGKAFAMDIHLEQHRVVVATSGRRTCIVDIRNPTTPELVLDRESSLKFQTRCVQFFPDGHSLALGSVEGRVGIEFFEELALPASMKKYAFKCHRVNDTVYPVNCIAFHPRILGTFATGGCDGTVGKYNWFEKKPIDCKLTIFQLIHRFVSLLLSFYSILGWHSQEKAHNLTLLSNFHISHGLQSRWIRNCGCL
jgi:cell cycle arrest protein BUB3